MLLELADAHIHAYAILAVERWDTETYVYLRCQKRPLELTASEEEHNAFIEAWRDTIGGNQ